MVVLDVVLREFSIVLLDLAFNEICRVGFLQQDVTHVLLILQDALDGFRAPVLIAGGGWNTHALQGFLYGTQATLKGTLSHTVTLGADVFGNITRLDNALENLPKALESEQAKLAETNAQLENARTELAAPFSREEELAEKTKRLKELNILLNMDEKDKTLMDDGPDEGEEVPARKSAELAR